MSDIATYPLKRMPICCRVTHFQPCALKQCDKGFCQEHKATVQSGDLNYDPAIIWHPNHHPMCLHFINNKLVKLRWELQSFEDSYQHLQLINELRVCLLTSYHVCHIIIIIMLLVKPRRPSFNILKRDHTWSLLVNNEFIVLQYQ